VVTYFILNERTLCCQQDASPLLALVTKAGSLRPPAGPLRIENSDVLRPVDGNDDDYFQLWMSQCLGEPAH